MFNSSAIRLYGALVAAILFTAAPATAQFEPRRLEDPATGEKFIVEGAAGFWNPVSTMVFSSAALGIQGTDIDLKGDLGLTDRRFGELHLVLRPATKHKLRFQYIPIKFQKEGHQISREITFNGQRYTLNTPVNWLFNWKAYRFGYEYDVFTRSRGFGGIVLDVKYTDVYAQLQTPFQSKPEFVHPRGPVPAIGGIGRYYIVPNISITGELTGISIPDSFAKELGADAHYFDLDIYGTLNFTNNLGVQVGYRSFDVGVTVTEDDGPTSAGTFLLKGLYFGVVARY
jgi:hypothetical protein